MVCDCLTPTNDAELQTTPKRDRLKKKTFSLCHTHVDVQEKTREFWDTPTSVFHPFEDVDMYLLDGVISFMISEFQTDSNTQY